MSMDSASLAKLAFSRANPTAAPISHMQAPSSVASAPDSASLAKLSLKELKERCKHVNTPCTGKKADLITRLLDPSKHQKYKGDPNKPKKTIAKKPKAPKQVPNPLAYLNAAVGYGGYGGYGHFGGYGSESDDDEHDYCEGCDGCFPFGEVDPHNGLCGDCAESMRLPGGCPCWRQTCQYSSEMEMFECEA